MWGFMSEMNEKISVWVSLVLNTKCGHLGQNTCGFLTGSRLRFQASLYELSVYIH